MSKIPEQLAEEYIRYDNESAYWTKHAFLAGYQAAKDSLLAQFKSLLSSYAETSFNPSHTAWQIFDALKEGQAPKDQLADVSNKGKVMETMDAKNTIESVIEMLEEHLDNICKAGLSEEGTDSLLHRPSYVLNLLRFFNEQQKTQES